MIFEAGQRKVDILLVDDKPSNLMALEAILSDLGQNLLKANSGEEALALLENHDFAVVLLDVQMPGLDGFKTAKIARQRERSRQTPIIFLTAFENDPKFSVEKAYDLGAVDYLIKPLVPTILRAKVVGFIELFRKTQQAASAEAQAQEQLRQLLATVNDLVLMLDRDLRLTYVNDRTVEITGLSREQIVGKRFRELFPDVAESVLERELEQAREDKAARHFDYHHAPSDRWFDNRVYPAPEGLILITTEVTEKKRAEKSLLQVAAIVESSDDAILSLDLDGHISTWNQGAERVYGYSREEAVGRHISFLMPKERHDDSEKLLAAVKEGRPLDHFVTRRKRKDGTLIDVSLTVSPIHNAAGQVIGASKISRDVTERKRAAERQRLLIEAGRILGSSLDYEATLADLCRLVVPDFADWCALDVVSEEGLPRRIHVAHEDPALAELARTFRKRYPPRPDDPRGLMKVLRTGEPEFVSEISDEMLVSAARDDEHLRMLRELKLRSVLIVPLSVSGRTIGALTLVGSQESRRFDEADLELAGEIADRAALAVENARLFAGAREAVRIRDEAIALHKAIEQSLTHLVEASGSLSASLDLPSVFSAVLTLSRKLIAADAYAVWRYHPESNRWGIELGSGLSDEFQAATVPGKGETAAVPESPIVAEDVQSFSALDPRGEAYGKEGIRSAMVIPLKVRGRAGGTLVFYYRAKHHFSPIEVRVGTALANLAGSAVGTAELYQELRENDQRKDEFLAMLAHELRNPLSAISNAVLLARQPQVEPKALEWSRQVVERQTGKLARLIDDLMDVSRITRGKIQLKKESVDARRLLQSAADSLRSLIDERKHEVSVSSGPGLLRLYADPVRIEQVLVNLLTNAAKYTPSGGRIWARVERKDSSLVFTVKDNGRGIEPDFLPHIFELFTQGERSIARSESGLGIGLTIVRKLVEMHGGSVSAQSDGPGQGSLFTVRLPASEQDALESMASPLQPKIAEQHLKILVVDDNEDTARGLAKILGLFGHEVETAFDGPSAVQAARNFEPDVVVLDIGLPGMTGYEVARSLRGEKFGDKLLVIALSGYGQDEDRRRSHEAGFDYHLVKPVDHTALLALLSR
jgi:PAS domain S-box-containing protein